MGLADTIRSLQNGTPPPVSPYQTSPTTNWDSFTTAGIGKDTLDMLNARQNGGDMSGYNIPNYGWGLNGGKFGNGMSNTPVPANVNSWYGDGGQLKSPNGWAWNMMPSTAQLQPDGTQSPNIIIGTDPSTNMNHQFDSTTGMPMGSYKNRIDNSDLLMAGSVMAMPLAGAALSGMAAGAGGAGAAAVGGGEAAAGGGVLDAMGSMPAWATTGVDGASMFGPGGVAAAGGSGAMDLGGGISMGADGGISGATPAAPYTGDVNAMMNGGAAASGPSMGNIANVAGKGLGMLGNSGGSSPNPNGGGFNLANLVNMGAGANTAYQQNQASSTMINWLQGQGAKLDALYSPNSPMAQSMWDQMSRTDAAAGRNSQYGPRTADFLGRYANQYGNQLTNFTTGTSRALSDALTQRATARSLPGLNAAFQNAAGSGGNLGSIINGLKPSTGALNVGSGVGSMAPTQTYDPSTSGVVDSMNSMPDWSTSGVDGASMFGDASNAASGNVVDYINGLI